MVRPPSRVSKATTSHAVELSELFFNSIKGPYGIVAAILLAVLLGFLGVGVIRPDFNPLALWLSAVILICAMGIAVLGIILDYKKQAYAAAISAESSPLRASFAHSLAIDIFRIVDGTATVTENEEAQSEAYVGLLVALRRTNPGEDEGIKEFKQQMARTVRESAHNSLSPSMLQRVRQGIDAQKSQIDILPDDA
jgi:hypothetical protein